MTVDPTPEEFRGVTPHVVVRDAGEASEFYARAFGADAIHEAYGHKAYGPDGRVWHVELLIAGGRMPLVAAYPDMGIDVPSGPTSVVLHMYVPDVDAAYATALAAGATWVMKPWDSFWATATARCSAPPVTAGRSPARPRTFPQTKPASVATPTSPNTRRPRSGTDPGLTRHRRYERAMPVNSQEFAISRW